MTLPRNLEIKSRVDDLVATEETAQAIGAEYRGIARQVDTYFCAERGRLKLREIDHEKAELIYYVRSEKNIRRWSEYEVFPVLVGDAGKLKAMLSRSIGVAAVVSKRRRLYMFENARIHIDTVDHLGDFLEFEVMMEKGERQAKRLLEHLMKAFGVKQKDCVKVSYSDFRQ
jgi:adenylate cyclase class 2